MSRLTVRDARYAADEWLYNHAAVKSFLITLAIVVVVGGLFLLSWQVALIILGVAVGFGFLWIIVHMLLDVL